MTIAILPYLEWPLASGSVPHHGAPTPYGQDGPDSAGSLLRQGGAQQGEEDSLRVGELTIGAERFVHHSPLWVGEVGPHEDGLQKKEARA